LARELHLAGARVRTSVLRTAPDPASALPGDKEEVRCLDTLQLQP
jgi:hypothetical protein